MHLSVNKSSGFVLVEALVVLIVVVALAALVALAGADARRQASLSTSIANLQQFAAATGAYGADNDDRVWSFSWRAGVDYGFGGVAASDLQAAANQAVDIMRRRGDPLMPQITSWIPHILYNQLVLADYLDLHLPQGWWASPEDRQLLTWQDDPSTLPPDPNQRRLRFQSSYEMGPAFYSPDAGNVETQTIQQDSQHNLFYTPANTPLGRRTLSEIRHPAQKALLYDRFQRHFGPRVAFFGYDEARLPVLAADGGIAVRRSSAANRGFMPNLPTSPAAARYTYTPSQLEPPALGPSGQDFVHGYYRWTRSGLRGRDFGGPEVPWVP